MNAMLSSILCFMKFRKKILPCELKRLDENESMRIHLAYARDDNLLFAERIYKKDTTLWLYKDLADIVKLAAKQCFSQYKIRFVVYDGLRVVEAQEAMMHTRRAQDNPQWMEEPRMLSVPGGGGHPRGMAVDIGLEDMNGTLLDMGSAFDFMGEESHRDYMHDPIVTKNRRILDSCMTEAAAALDHELVLLPQEWWDFRFPASLYEQFVPLSDKKLPKEVQQIFKKNS